MTIDEFIRMAIGRKIEPYLQEFENALTSSKGLCFLGEETVIEDDEHKKIFNPQSCYKFLRGIVSSEVLVEFELEDVEKVTESFGRYANPFNDDGHSYVYAKEYCMPSYDKKTLIPKRYAFGDEKFVNFFEYDEENIDINKIIEHTENNDILRYSLLKQIPKCKGFWTEIVYNDPGIDEERTNVNWIRERLVYGDIITRQEQFSIDMVLDSTEVLESDVDVLFSNSTNSDKLVRFVINGECPPACEKLFTDFICNLKKVHLKNGITVEDGTFRKDYSEELFKKFWNLIALTMVYPDVADLYKLCLIKNNDLDLVVKSFDIDENRKWRNLDIISTWLDRKLDNEIERNSVGNIVIKKENEEYQIFVNNAMADYREFHQDDEKYEYESYKAGHKNVGTIKEHGDFIIIQNYSSTLILDSKMEYYEDGGQMFISLPEKYKKTVQREKAKASLLKSIKREDEFER